MQNVKLLLVGNPNAGKSTLFNKITGGHAKVGNWHGVTVGALEKRVALKGGSVTVCDLPGIYAADALSMEEKLAVAYLKREEGAPVLFVTECGMLDRSLPLFFQLAAGRPAMLVLTKRKRFFKAGGYVDCEALSHRLHIPVIFAEQYRKKELLALIDSFLFSQQQVFDGKEVAPDEKIFRPERVGFSRVDKLLTSGWFCFPFFFVLLLAMFFLTFYPRLLGDLMKSGLEALFCDVLGGYAERISSPVLRSFVRDGILSSVGGVWGFLPQIALLYLFLILLEESGLLSRLAALTDGAFSKVGLNGRATFSLLMGFGCTAAAIATTRGLDDEKMQRRVILSLPYISCSAKLPVYLALSASFFENPFVAVVLLYALGVGLSLIVSLFLKEKKREPFILELAPLQIPRPAFVIKSLLFQIKQFIIKVATVILAFFLLSWLLSSFDFTFTFCPAERSMLATLCGGFKYLFAPIGLGDWRVAYAALSGLIAKENVAGALFLFFGDTLPFSAQSAFAFAVFMLATSPCVSAIAASAREVGKWRALLYALIQTISALLLSYITYFALAFSAAYFFLLPALIAFLIVGKKTFENLHRKRKHNLKGLHGQRKRAGVFPFSHSLKRWQAPRKRQARKERLPAYGRRSGGIPFDRQRGANDGV